MSLTSSNSDVFTIKVNRNFLNKYKYEILTRIAKPDEVVRKRFKELYDSGKAIGVRIVIEDDVLKPLVEVGLKKEVVINSIRYILGKGLIKNYAGGSDQNQVEITDQGYDWLFAEDEGKTDNKQNQFQKFNIINIPPDATYKIKKLIVEINNLPKGAEEAYPNLIVHQFRTVIALGLMDFWKINNKTIPENKKNLHKLIEYTINNAQSESLPEAKRVVGLLNKIINSSYKDFADDIIHCNYTLVINSDLVNDFGMAIGSLLSTIYGR